MSSVYKLTGALSRNTRRTVVRCGTLSFSNFVPHIFPLGTSAAYNKSLHVCLQHNRFFYTKHADRKGGSGSGKKDCTFKPVDCKPKPEKKPKTIDPKDCQKKPLPHLQECVTPNLMSECPKPDCPYDETKKKKDRSLLFLALLALAASIGAVIYFISQKVPEEETETPPPPKVKKPKKRVIQKIPPSSKSIPHEVPYLLIGGGTAAFAAFRAIKSNDPTAKVLVVGAEDQFPYMRPPLSKEMWYVEDDKMVNDLNFKQWNGTQRSLFYEPEDFYLKTQDLMVNENGGVAVARGWRITHLDVINRKAYLDDGTAITYGKCLIATGSTPQSLEVFESADEKVTDKTVNYRSLEDFRCLRERLKAADSVAIIGGGFLGSELACALARRTKKDANFKVHLVAKESGVMGQILPEYLSFWTSERIKADGVTLYESAEVLSVAASNDDVNITLTNGKKIKAQLVVVAVGAVPDTSMAEKSDLEVDPDLGGYLVNTELQARSHLYVAGDAACFYDPALGRRRIEHHDNAVISGRLAGENMTGAEKPYVHQSMYWSDLGPDLGYEAIGIVNSSLPTVGVFAKTDSKEVKPEEVAKEVPDECLKYLDKEAEQKALSDKAENLEKKKEAEERRRKVAAARPGEDFSKGVIFYLRDDIIVGIVLWNIFNRMNVARQVLKDQRKYDDLNEVAKLFNIHEE